MKIILIVNGEEMVLEHDEARRIHAELDEFFGQKETPPFREQPWIPPTNPYPDGPWAPPNYPICPTYPPNVPIITCRHKSY